MTTFGEMIAVICIFVLVAEAIRFEVPEGANWSHFKMMLVWWFRSTLTAAILTLLLWLLWQALRILNVIYQMIPDTPIFG